MPLVARAGFGDCGCVAAWFDVRCMSLCVVIMSCVCDCMVFHVCSLTVMCLHAHVHVCRYVYV